MAKKSITKNYIYNLTYQILTLILPLITTPYISRTLQAEAIGIYGYTYSIVTYFILFGSLGIALYGQREIAYAQKKVRARKKIFFELIIFRLITMSISIFFYYMFFIRGKEYQNYYAILLIELIATCFDISWFFQGMEEFKKTVIRNIAVRLASVSLVFILVKSPNDLEKYMYIYTIAVLIGNISLWLYLPKYFKGVQIKNINVFKHMPHIVLLFIPQIANQIYNMLDKTMIGKIIADKTEVGYYEQGQKVIRLLLTVVTSLGIVMVPRMASTFASGDEKQVKKYMKNSFNFVFLLAFPIMFGIISISKAFVPVFFGEGYEKVVYLINIISPIILLMGISNVIGTQYLLPTKRQKEYTLSVTVGVIVNFILNAILITSYASIGASIATVVSQLIVDIVQLNCIKREINLRKIFKLSYKYIFASVIMFAVCSIIKIFVPMGILSIILQGIIGMIVYIGILIWLRDEYIFAFARKILKKIDSLNRDL